MAERKSLLKNKKSPKPSNEELSSDEEKSPAVRQKKRAEYSSSDEEIERNSGAKPKKTPKNKPRSYDDDNKEEPVSKSDKKSKSKSHSASAKKLDSEDELEAEPVFKSKKVPNSKYEESSNKSNRASEVKYVTGNEPMRKHVIKQGNKLENYQFSSTDDEENEEEYAESRKEKSNKGNISTDEEEPIVKCKKKNNVELTSSSSGDDDDSEVKSNRKSKSKYSSTTDDEETSSDEEETQCQQKKIQSVKPPWCSSIKTTPAKKPELRKPMLTETKVPGFYLLLLNEHQEEQVRKSNAREQMKKKKLDAARVNNRVEPDRYHLASNKAPRERRVKSADPRETNETKRIKVVSFQDNVTYHGRMRNKSTSVLGTNSSPSRNDGNSSSASLEDSDSPPSTRSSSSSKKSYQPKILEPIKVLVEESKRKAERSSNSDVASPPSFFGQETFTRLVEKGKEMLSDVSELSLPYINEVKKVDAGEVSSKIAGEFKQCITNGENCIEYDMNEFDQPQHELVPAAANSDYDLQNRNSSETLLSEEKAPLKANCMVSILGNAQPVSANEMSLKSGTSNVNHDERKMATLSYIRETKSAADADRKSNETKEDNKGQKSGIKTLFKGITGMFKRKNGTQAKLTTKK